MKEHLTGEKSDNLNEDTMKEYIRKIDDYAEKAIEYCKRVTKKSSDSTIRQY